MLRYGELNGANIGVIGKEIVRRAIKAIRDKRFIFEKSEKLSYQGVWDDLVTDADKAAQAIYEKMIKEHFPKYGIIGEENNLFIKGKYSFKNSYLTVDPLDGTKAFARQQSDGIGTMLSLVKNKEVIAAWVGDVISGEIYYYRPNSAKVHRLTDLDNAVLLEPDFTTPINEKYVMLRDRVELYSPNVQYMLEVNDKTNAGIFKNLLVGGGSIGVQMAKLWKNEVAAVILRPHTSTPWDWTPVYGICKKLGFTFYKRKNKFFTLSYFWREYDPGISDKLYEIDHEILIIHSGYKESLDDKQFIKLE